MVVSKKEREAAAVLYKSLLLARDLVETGEKNTARILMKMRSLIASEPAVKLDYLVAADPETLEETKIIKGRVLIALAAYVGKARLIDNLVVKAK